MAAADDRSSDGRRLWIAFRVGELCQDGRLAVVDLRSGEVEVVARIGRVPEPPIVDGPYVWINNTFHDT